jgi:hypothetical protein
MDLRSSHGMRSHERRHEWRRSFKRREGRGWVRLACLVCSHQAISPTIEDPRASLARGTSNIPRVRGVAERRESRRVKSAPCGLTEDAYAASGRKGLGIGTASTVENGPPHSAGMERFYRIIASRRGRLAKPPGLRGDFRLSRKIGNSIPLSRTFLVRTRVTGRVFSADRALQASRLGISRVAARRLGGVNVSAQASRATGLRDGHGFASRAATRSREVGDT